MELVSNGTHFNRMEISSEIPEFLTGGRYGDRRFIKWARFCPDGQLA